MSVFEYVTVLTSIIIGLALAHLLLGLANIVQHPKRKKLYWVHLAWVGFMIFSIATWWWWEFRYNDAVDWSIWLYFFILFYALLYYMICALLFPTDLHDYDGFKNYFLSRRRWIFGFMATALIVDLADTALKGADYFFALGPPYFALVGVQLALFAIAALAKHERWQGIAVVTIILVQAAWTVFAYL
jgi:hypothetical protein